MFKLKALGVKDALERASKARQEINPDKLPRYYLPYLDNTLVGICLSELVVIGSDTGKGKTHMANHLAIKNAQAGKKVYLFSLEGHKNEVINRWKWQLICKKYYQNPDGREMNYIKYEMNMIKDLEEYEKYADEQLSSLEGNLFIYDRSQGLTVQSLAQELTKAVDFDLVIVDHLHYFDMLDDKSETQNITEIMKGIKMLTEERQVPVVLISHLRKKDSKRGLPDNEDFHGSSNIPKIATTCILLESNPDNHDLTNGVYATFIRTSKSRAGASTTLAGEVFFDTKKQDYVPNKMDLGKVINGNFTYLEREKMPFWALRYKETK